MVRVGHLFVLAAAVADVCAAFVAPVGSAAAGLTRLQHARISVSERSQSSALHRAGAARASGSQSRRRQLGLQMQQEPSKWAGGGINVSGEAPFEIRGFSLANAAALVGLAITVASFFEYFSTGGAGGLSGIGFVYGIPIALIGLALKYAELPPAPLQTTPEEEELLERKATGTVEPNGELGLTMVFQSRAMPFKMWVEPERIQKYVNFFGPGVDAEVIKVDHNERLVAIKLTTLPPGVQPTPKVVAPPPAAEEASAPPPATEAAVEEAAPPATEA